MKETWKDIKGYEGLYHINKNGDILSLRTNIIRKQSLQKTGYLQITLCVNNINKTLYVHRLVAEAFIPNPNSLPQVNHKDGNKANNNVANLEWCDACSNKKHAINNGLCYVNGTGNPNSKYSNDQIEEVKTLLKKGLGGTEIQDITGVHRSTVYNIKNKRSWR